MPILLTFSGFAFGTDMSYLDNGTIKVGIDLDRGATMTYLSLSGSTASKINYHDAGRCIQQSYYSGPIPFQGGNWMGWDWPWNPVAAGDHASNWATVLSNSNDGTTIYAKSVPKQWALDNVDSECTMERWITLESNVVHVHYRLIMYRADTTQYSAWYQELPAIYTTDDLYHLYTYTGSSPFTSGALTEIIDTGEMWEDFDTTEHWAAQVDDSDWGIGIFHPEATYCRGGFYGTPGSGDPLGDSTGYLAPRINEILDYNITYEYDCYIILDYLSNIRSYVYAHQPNQLPDYVFDDDRQGWYYRSGLYDAGWPVTGYLRVLVEQNDPYMFGPRGIWQATDAPVFHVRARYNTTNTNAKLFWRNFDGPGFIEAQSKSFTIISDGQFHTYEVDLSCDPNYSGVIKQLRFDLVSNGSPGDYVDMEYIVASSSSIPPIIAEVTPDPNAAFAGTEYIKQLQLSQGLFPITWSVIHGPTGTQVNGSGQVSGWTPTACNVGSSFTFEIQAQNAHGSDTETWQVEPKEFYLQDSVIDFLDLAMMCDEWLFTGGNLATDLNCSNDVNFLDYAIFADEYSSGEEPPPPDLEITDLSPGTDDDVSYNDLDVGELMYVDRLFTYNTVPSAYQNKTYIKTGNDDKDSSDNNFMSFDVNRAVSVYVAHDDRLTSKPSWLTADFTDTGDYLVSGSADHEHLSLYKRDYSSACTVTLGGNEGGGQPNCSMYTVVVVEQ